MDISVIAATKYLSGHSDVTMGIVVINEKEWKNFDKLPEALGFTTSPDDAYLVLRGMRTLDVRMKAHEKSADEIVEFYKAEKKLKQFSIQNSNPTQIMKFSCVIIKVQMV